MGRVGRKEWWHTFKHFILTDITTQREMMRRNEFVFNCFAGKYFFTFHLFTWGWLSISRPEEHFQSLTFLWFLFFVIRWGGDGAGVESQWVDVLVEDWWSKVRWRLKRQLSGKLSQNHLRNFAEIASLLVKVQSFPLHLHLDTDCDLIFAPSTNHFKNSHGNFVKVHQTS